MAPDCRVGFGCEVRVAPDEQCPQHGAKILADRGEPVFVARRMGAVADLRQQAGLDQFAQAPRQDVRGDAEVGLELVEAGFAVEGIAQDQDRPPVADAIETAGDGAGGGGEAGVLHGVAFVMQAT